VATRAYPANAKKRNPADASTPCRPASGQSGERRSGSGSPASRHAATTKARDASTATTITRVTAAVFETPR
jgi:hypothetical protein